MSNILKIIRDTSFSFEAFAKHYPELDVLKNTPQNPEFHAEGNVYIHTGMVCDSLIHQDEWQQLSSREQELLYLSAAFHDIGKSVCTKLEDGILRSRKHTIKGEPLFRSFVYRDADRYGLSFTERENVAKLIRYHGLPVWFLEKNRPEASLIKVAEIIPLRLLYLLAKADCTGRIGKDRDKLLVSVELFKEMATELGIWNEPYSFANPYTRFQYYLKDDLPYGASLYDSTSFDVILMSGLPLSGKDTWIGRHAVGMRVISLDDLREELRIPPGEDSSVIAEAALKQAKECLRRKEPFIWNATNIIESTRKKLIRKFTAYGARVTIVYLEAPYLELLSRNQKRERYIPTDVLERMINKLEIPDPWEAFQVKCFAADQVS